MRADDLVLVLLLGLVGAAAGSCIGLLSLRLPVGRPVGLARSACMTCRAKLRAFELVPLVSYLVQRGRCRRCTAPIARRYPLLEAAGSAIGVIAALAVGGPASIAAAVLGWWLLLLAVLDAEHYWLPSAVTLPLIAAGLAACVWLDPAELVPGIIGAAAGWASLAAVASAYRLVRHRDGLGGGDARLFAASGAWLGWDRLPLVLLGASLSALLLVVLFRRRFTATDRLPFGVFLAGATWVLYLVQP